LFNKSPGEIKKILVFEEENPDIFPIFVRTLKSKQDYILVSHRFSFLIYVFLHAVITKDLFEKEQTKKGKEFEKQVQNIFKKNGYEYIPNLKRKHLEIDGALDYGMELGRTVRPQYYLRLEEIQPLLRYRLQIEEKQRREKAVKMAKRGMKFERIFDELLPWKFEIGVGSRELGITGRIDQVYKINTSLIPLDFKTHRNRIAALIFRESHFEQLAVYALLLEQKYPEYSANMGIIKYTEDLHDEKFTITSKAKKNVIEHIKQARELIQKNQLPPKLSGEESIKCQSCYLRKFCFALEDGGGEIC